jgi:predicted amidophosphoribosyltransferase
MALIFLIFFIEGVEGTFSHHKLTQEQKLSTIESFCSECGKTTGNKANFCKHCGAELIKDKEPDEL